MAWRQSLRPMIDLFSSYVKRFFAVENFSCICLLFVVASVLIGLSPLYTKHKDPDFSQLQHAVETHQFSQALAVLSVVCIPMFIDIILDFLTIFPFSISNSQNESMWEGAGHWLSRLSLCLGIAIPSIKMKEFVDHCLDESEEYKGNWSNAQSSEVYICLYLVSFVVSVASLLSILCENKHAYLLRHSWTHYQSLLSLSFVLIAQGIFSYALISDTAPPSMMFVIGVCFGAIFELMLLFVVSSWMWSLMMKTDRFSPRECIVSWYLIFLVVKNIAFMIIVGGNPSFSSESVCSLVYVEIAFVISVTLAPGREARLNRDLGAQSVREKSQFISYISHEIRTPLTTVFLGLSFVTKEIDKLSSVVHANKLFPITDTLLDMNDSCQVALSILNDLLTADKLDGGKLEVELEHADPLHFIRQAYRAFKIFSKRGNIEYRLVCVDEETGWIDKHFVMLDKHKFSQVLRNLVSNAFKFTSRDGSVTITISRQAAHTSDKDIENYSPRLRSDSSINVGTTNVFSRMRSMLGLNFSRRFIRRRRSSRKLVFPQGASVMSISEVLRVEVTDSGAGISAENQKKLFGQYVQFNANVLQKGKGSGLGLWISKGKSVSV